MNLEPISISQQQQDDYKLGLNFFHFFFAKKGIIEKVRVKEREAKISNRC